MKKLFAMTAATIAAASSATAGSIAYVAPDATTMIEEAAPMGGSGSWLIPLVILGVLVLALTSGEDTPPNA